MATSLSDLHLELQQHKIEDKAVHLEVYETRKDIRDIKENHLAHIQASITNIELFAAKTNTNQEWLLRFFWVIVPAVIGSLVIGFMNLLTK